MRKTTAVACVIVLAALAPARAEDRSPGINCTTSGNFTNCNTAGEGTFDTVVAAVKLLAQRPASEDEDIIARIKREKDSVPPPFLLELSRRLVVSDKQEALYYLYLASARSSYDARRCRDRTAEQGVQVVITSLRAQMRPVTDYLRTKPKLGPIFQLLKDRDETFTGTASPWWVCSHGMTAIVAATSGKALRTEDWLKPESEWAQIQAEFRKSLDGSIANHKDD